MTRKPPISPAIPPRFQLMPYFLKIADCLDRGTHACHPLTRAFMLVQYMLASNPSSMLEMIRITGERNAIVMPIMAESRITMLIKDLLAPAPLHHFLKTIGPAMYANAPIAPRMPRNTGDMCSLKISTFGRAMEYKQPIKT